MIANVTNICLEPVVLCWTYVKKNMEKNMEKGDVDARWFD